MTVQDERLEHSEPLGPVCNRIVAGNDMVLVRARCRKALHQECVATGSPEPVPPVSPPLVAIFPRQGREGQARLRCPVPWLDPVAISSERVDEARERR